MPPPASLPNTSATWEWLPQLNEAILKAAEKRQAVIITLDADFYHLLAASRATSPSVVRIRIEGLNSNQLATALVQVIATADAELSSAAVVSVTENRIRVRRLPIRR